MTNFTVIKDEEAVELRRLRQFYLDVRELTIQHDTLDTGSDSVAVVYPDQLAKALEKVNAQWSQS